MAYAAVISLQNIIENLKNSLRFSLVPPSDKIMRSAYEELQSLQASLEILDNTSKSYCRKKVNAVDTQIKEAVWKFEDLVERLVSKQILAQSEIDGLLQLVDLQELGEDVDSFIGILKKLEEEYINELHHLSPEKALDGAASSKPHYDANKSKMVGSSDILRKTEQNLTHYEGFNVISIVGMAGIGKTALANEIFAESRKYSFQYRAWVTIGRNYRLDQLKRDILLQFGLDIKIPLEEGDEEHVLGHQLKSFLKDISCLIVLDDVWDTSVCNYLRPFVPEVGKNQLIDQGMSRLLLTTRLQHVANHAGTHVSMKLLNKDQSWDLLRERVFGEDSCPPELERDGKKIAENCDGLPLMIVTVAESLTKAEKTVKYWNNVAEKKTCSLFMDAYDKISEVLFPSYEYLPQHLKPCFLHMGVFLPGYEISRYKLLSMWISEMFLGPRVKQTLEERAARYLKELRYHNVAMRCQKSTRTNYASDNAKTCRLHSSFWYLCCKEARKNKFFHVLSSPADVLEESMKNQRRLSVHNNILFGINGVHDSIVNACASTARSLLCYGAYHPFPVPMVFSLRLLRVLDALHIRFYEFPLQVLQLVRLRYLALTCNNSLPASISKLLNLKFLIIHRHMSIKIQGDTPYVPVEVWDMQELKHIQIMGCNLPNPSSWISMKSLLELLGVSAVTCTKEVLEKIPNLTKLGIQIDLHPNDDMKALHCLNHIDVLSELRSLKCVIVNPKLRSEIVSLPAPLSMFPSSLKKLHLSGLGYPWIYMDIVGSLPYLEVLKLRCYAFRGPKWEVKGEGSGSSFPRLGSLLIEGTDLVQLKVEPGGFPSLHTMRLKHCYKLLEVWWEKDGLYPRKIELIYCSPSAGASVGKGRRRVSVHSSWEHGNLK